MKMFTGEKNYWGIAFGGFAALACKSLVALTQEQDLWGLFAGGLQGPFLHPTAVAAIVTAYVFQCQSAQAVQAMLEEV